jgi:hypothetical protein
MKKEIIENAIGLTKFSVRRQKDSRIKAANVNKDRNTIESLEQDYEHLDKMRKTLNKIDTSSNDRANIIYLSQLINDWQDEIDKILKAE